MPANAPGIIAFKIIAGAAFLSCFETIIIIGRANAREIIML
jgi:hypothetical protein